MVMAFIANALNHKGRGRLKMLKTRYPLKYVQLRLVTLR